MKPIDRPAPDDGPEPYRTTPRRLSRQIRDRSVECADLAIRIRELAAFMKAGPLDVAVQELLTLSSMLSAHSIAVLVGKAEILPELADGHHQPERPLLDVIEAAPVRPPPVHPAAGPAREAARRRKTPGQGKPVDPETWKTNERDERLAAGVAAALDKTMPASALNGRKGGVA